MAALVFTSMTTWKRGREILSERLQTGLIPVADFAEILRRSPPTRVSGTAVFMYSNPAATPPALLHNLKHNKVLHDRVVFLSVVTEEVPHVPPVQRPEVRHLADGIYQVVLHYGFMEDVDVPSELSRIKHPDLTFKPMDTTYFLGRETLIASKREKGMAVWRERLFSVMSRNANSATAFFRLPPNRVVELGAQIRL
jgi:KUP system potassium uptake protein